MKYLKLFENFEQEEYDPYSYSGCGCCPVCTGEKDCECGCPECNNPEDYDISDHDGIGNAFDNLNDTNENILSLLEKNVAVDKSLWNSCTAWAKSKYDVWPSAYACGAAAKRYKAKGGKWKKKKKG